MNINREQVDELNAIIQIHFEPADYDKQVADTLEDYRKKARMDGFRPGKVPAGLIKKLYGKTALVDEINKILSESLNTHIREEELQILGEPIPNPDSPKIDWENQSEFDFHFDIGLTPEFELKLTKRDKVPFYRIIVSDEMIDNQIESHTKRYGLLEPAETASAGDLLYVSLVQLDEQNSEVDNGIHTDDTLVSLDSIEDETLKEMLSGSQVNDEFTVDSRLLFPNETDRATALNVKKSQLDETGSSRFKMTVQQIKHFVPAEINQDLFDKVYGEGEVTSEEAFRERILEGLQKQFEAESNFKFHADAKIKVLDKIEVLLPDEFLKRWLKLTGKEKQLTDEQIEKEYPDFARNLKWSLIKNRIIKEQELKADEEEIKKQAITSAYKQYQQYGIYQVEQEQLIQLAEAFLKDENEQRRLIDVILEDKVIDYIRTLVKEDEKEITLEEFQKLFD